jgi:hypothetical protein
MKYITVIVFALISVCMGVLFGGCKGKQIDTVVVGRNTVSTPLRLKHDTIFIHDTIYRTKVTHINHSNSIIIGGDSNGEIIQN